MDFQLVDTGWDRALADAVAADPSEIRLISPFIKTRAAKRLIEGVSPDLIHVVTRFNLTDFYEGVSDTAAVRLLLNAGARIRGVRHLHAKAYLFGRTRAIVTSANLTEAALRRNHEFGFTSGDASIIERCRQYFDALWARAGDDVTLDRLDAWDARLTAAKLAHPRVEPSAPLPDEGVDVGLDVNDVAEPPARVTGASQAFVKFFGEWSNRSLYSRPVVEEVSSSGCHWACTYPEGRRPRQPGDGDVMYMGRMMYNPTDIIVYGRAIAMAHQPGRDDASPADIERRSWKRDWPHYVRVHHPGGIL